MAELERLRAAYRERGPAGTDHLSEDQWERLSCDELTPDERNSALEHILQCAECSRVYRGILALRSEAHTFDPGAPSPRKAMPTTLRWRWRRILPGLAAAAALVAAFLFLRPLTRPGPAVSGGPGTVTLRKSGRPAGPVLVAPVGAVSGVPDQFSWRPVEGARGYVVELLDADGEMVWKSEEVTSVRAPWPEAVPRTPGRYYWRVLAVPDGGGEPVASGLEAFDIGVSASPR